MGQARCSATYRMYDVVRADVDVKVRGKTLSQDYIH